ncbi:MAG TPA: carboxypeptidase-like regulatory domain-containing protein [Pyrinomonadaceae bacterium]
MESVIRGAKYFCLAAALVVFVCSATPARAQVSPDREQAPKRVGVRLRAFVPNTSASMYFVPTRHGGSVRLTALNLPPAGSLLADASHYVVWAVASEERPLRIGSLMVDAGGNGGLEFARPASFERYSVVVTAETSAEAERPGGVMVFASRAGAVSAFYGERNEQQLSESQRKALAKEMKKTAGRSGVRDFYSEVDDALDANPGGARVIELLGGELAPKSHGVARVATRNENVYVRTVLRRLPVPSEIGANTYILWGLIPGGRIAYMGSLPSTDFSDADTYVRVGGIRTDELDLLVSAERRRPVPSPSGQRVLYSNTQSEERGLAYGAIEGMVLDADSQPVAGATVELRPDSRSVTPDTLPTARTDESGRFFLDGLVPGEHTLYASKETAGYPSAYQAFFIAGDTALPKVAVLDRQVAGGTVVRLGPKAARLRARVLDGRTGQPVEEAEIVLLRDDRQDISMSFGINPADGSFDRLIPSLPLRLKVQAPGYDDWYYGEDGTRENSRVLLLRNDAVEELTIRLRPNK